MAKTRSYICISGWWIRCYAVFCYSKHVTEYRTNQKKIGIKKIRRTHMGWGVLLELLYTNHPPLPLQSQILPSSMR